MNDIKAKYLKITLIIIITQAIVSIGLLYPIFKTYSIISILIGLWFTFSKINIGYLKEHYPKSSNLQILTWIIFSPIYSLSLLFI